SRQDWRRITLTEATSATPRISRRVSSNRPSRVILSLLGVEMSAPRDARVSIGARNSQMNLDADVNLGRDRQGEPPAARNARHHGGDRFRDLRHRSANITLAARGIGKRLQAILISFVEPVPPVIEMNHK